MEILTALILGLVVPALVLAVAYASSYGGSMVLWAPGSIFSVALLLTSLLIFSADIVPGFLAFMGFAPNDDFTNLPVVIVVSLYVGTSLSGLACVAGGLWGFDHAAEHT